MFFLRLRRKAFDWPMEEFFGLSFHASDGVSWIDFGDHHGRVVEQTG